MTIKQSWLTLLLLASSGSHAADFLVTDAAGEPVSPAMVTASPLAAPEVTLGDMGYPPHGVTNRAAVTLTRFTDAAGRASFAAPLDAHSIRVRARGFIDATLSAPAGEGPTEVVLQPMSREQYIASFPSNVWLSQLRFGGDAGLKKTFQLNCAFCHQQASPFMRNERTVEQWLGVFERMNSYGARLPAEDHQRIAELLQRELRELRENPQQVPEPRPWDPYLADYEITEWPIGDGFSQMHDFLLHPNGFVYVGDNLFDRIYEVNPDTGDYTVYKVPHRDGDTTGGILGNRFTVFPKMDNTMGVHSFAYSKRDGNIFITPSMQQALLEFNPETKAFTIHEMDAGYYPHTIRTDDQDRVWFTLALSSQVARFDRDSGEFTLYDLPARSIREWLVLKVLPFIFWMDPERRPQPAPDREGTGLPMPYGIDVAPDGRVWVARLYANDLAVIDPATDEVTMIDFPFEGPRRLRADADGKLWIVAFQDSLLVQYDPASDTFTDYPLPVRNEIPYALNVDRERGTVWVNGNQSDTIMSFDIASERWRVYPMPRQRFFTRDIEVADDSGAIYTSNSHFPTWQTEGGVPTLLRITPLAE
ncbi:MAG: lyase [Haliea sp.]|uniref:lyase n=1 Tax=Haliea sp. TaxID=1932666 RepID=UPI0032EF64CB